MADSNLEVSKRGFEEYNRTGPSGVIDLMIRLDRLHPDYLFHVQEGLPTAGTYHGVKGYQGRDSLISASLGASRSRSEMR